MIVDLITLNHAAAIWVNKSIPTNLEDNRHINCTILITIVDFGKLPIGFSNTFDLQVCKICTFPPTNDTSLQTSSKTGLNANEHHTVIIQKLFG